MFTRAFAESKHNTEINVNVNKNKYNCEPNGLKEMKK